MKKFANCIGLSLILGVLAGCSSVPNAQYVPINRYQSYDCAQMGSEFSRLNQYINANLNQRSGFTMSGVGLGIGIGQGGIYPNISLGVGQVNAGNRQNLAVALGERDALIQSARLRQCIFINGVKLSTEK